jgi:hypothetical protein
VPDDAGELRLVVEHVQHRSGDVARAVGEHECVRPRPLQHPHADRLRVSRAAQPVRNGLHVGVEPGIAVQQPAGRQALFDVVRVPAQFEGIAALLGGGRRLIHGTARGHPKPRRHGQQRKCCGAPPVPAHGIRPPEKPTPAAVAGQPRTFPDPPSPDEGRRVDAPGSRMDTALRNDRACATDPSSLVVAPLLRSGPGRASLVRRILGTHLREPPGMGFLLFVPGSSRQRNRK